MKNLIYLLTAIILISACKKDDYADASATGKNCVFVQDDTANDGIIDDEERAIMQECYENKLQDKTEIENTIIGEWELIGHGNGWVPLSQPCGHMTFTNDGMLTFDFEDTSGKRTTTHAWEVIEGPSVGMTNNFFIEISNGVPGVGTSIICSNYIYSDATPVDGDMYLYRKVN